MAVATTVRQHRAALFFLSLCLFSSRNVPASPIKKLNGPPVILLPGDGGTHMEAKLNKPSVPHWWCYQKSDYYNLWLNLEEMVPYTNRCWADNMRLIYDVTTHQNANSPGVQVIIPDFGNTSSVEWLDPTHSSVGSYFNPLVDKMVEVGYVRGLSVRGAPFDFRKAPNEYQEFYGNLTGLIEETYKLNGDRPVVIITHSMGGPTALHYLDTKTKAWKEKYIRSVAAISPPWAGAPKVLRVITSGDNLGNYILNALVLRIGQRSFPSSAWLIPSYKYWDCDEALVFTPQRNYSVCDLDQLFDDMKYPIGKHLYRDTKDLIVDLKAPEVKVYMLHGVDVDTESAYVYDNDGHVFPDDQPVIKMTPGDGTVPLKSFQAALKWKKEQKEELVVKEFPGPQGEHLAILQNPDMINYVLKEILQVDNSTRHRQWS